MSPVADNLLPGYISERGLPLATKFQLTVNSFAD